MYFGGKLRLNTRKLFHFPLVGVGASNGEFVDACVSAMKVPFRQKNIIFNCICGIKVRATVPFIFIESFHILGVVHDYFSRSLSASIHCLVLMLQYSTRIRIKSLLYSIVLYSFYVYLLYVCIG